MNDFIKQQQELARKVNEVYKQMAGDVLMGGIPDAVLDTLITQIITNTGEELMRLVEGERITSMTGIGLYEDEKAHNQAIDTLKKHITNVTGVE